MKKNEIKVGGHYSAKVGGRVVTVRVDKIGDDDIGLAHGKTVCHGLYYDVTNLATGRRTTFRSAAKFRSEVKTPQSTTDKPRRQMTREELGIPMPSAAKEAEQRPDHTPASSAPNVEASTRADVVRGNVTCPRCDAMVVAEDGRYAYHKHATKGITCGMSGEKVQGLVTPVGEVLESSARSRSKEGEQCSDPTSASPRDSVGSGKRKVETMSGVTNSTTVQAGGQTSARKSETAPASAPFAKSSGTLDDTVSPAPSTNGLLSALNLSESNGKVAGYTPTEEQAAILEAVKQPGLEVLVIAAGAGAGKTSQLRMLETILFGSGVYTTFSRPLVNDAKTKFQRAKCYTQHGLAFSSVGKLYAHRLNGNRVRSDEIARILGIESMSVTMPDPLGAVGEDGRPVVAVKTLRPSYLAGQVMEAIKKFCQSADRGISRRHFKGIIGVDKPGEYKNQRLVQEALVPFAQKAWDDLCDVNGRLPFSHDCYVKIWQLGERDKAPVIPASYILLDEYQDTAEVFLDVLKRQSALLVLVGDDNQRIYEWRGAVNAADSFPDAPRKLLSQSFRFGQAVADVANSILAGLDEPTDLVMKGCDIPSRVILPSPVDPADDNEYGRPIPSSSVCRAVLCRTNACAVATVLLAVKDKKRPHLVGGGAEMISFVKAAQQLQQGRGTSHPELCLFSSWSEVQAYVKEDEGSDLKLLVKLIDEFKCQPILDALEKMPSEEDADLVVSTAHKSKGREWTSVRLAPDFPPANRMSDPDRRLLYVAATRAQHLLDLSECTPFLPGKDRDTGKEVKPIRVTFTKPQPTAKDLEKWVVEKTGGIPVVIAAPKPAASPAVASPETPAGAPAEFTWANYDGGWKVGGPRGYENQTVEVKKRSGATSTERLGAVIRDYGDRCIYDLQGR